MTCPSVSTGVWDIFVAILTRPKERRQGVRAYPGGPLSAEIRSRRRQTARDTPRGRAAWQGANLHLIRLCCRFMLANPVPICQGCGLSGFPRLWLPSPLPGEEPAGSVFRRLFDFAGGEGEGVEAEVGRVACQAQFVMAEFRVPGQVVHARLLDEDITVSVLIVADVGPAVLFPNRLAVLQYLDAERRAAFRLDDRVAL